jgi:hypothetical protein
VKKRKRGRERERERERGEEDKQDYTEDGQLMIVAFRTEIAGFVSKSASNR